MNLVKESGIIVDMLSIICLGLGLWDNILTVSLISCLIRNSEIAQRFVSFPFDRGGLARRANGCILMQSIDPKWQRALCGF